MDNLTVGTWIRFYTNSTRPNTTHIGKIYKLWTIKISNEVKTIGYWVENATMRYQISWCDVSEVITVTQLQLLKDKSDVLYSQKGTQP